MSRLTSLFWACIFISSCSSGIGNNGSVIIFADVIGSYEGECADYNNAIIDLMNREDAVLSVVAVNSEEAKIKVSCIRFEDQQVTVKSASASEVLFEKNISVNKVITLKYIAATDSIVLTQTNAGDNNILFAGIRK